MGGAWLLVHRVVLVRSLLLTLNDEQKQATIYVKQRFVRDQRFVCLSQIVL